MKNADGALRRLLDSWRQADLRYPRLTTLRLPWLLVWVLIGSFLSWILAPWYVGSLGSALASPEDYKTFVLSMSMPVALGWVYVQWRDRPALPRSAPLGLVWSTLSSTACVMAILSVQWMAEAAARSHLRTLVPVEILQSDVELFKRDRPAFSIAGRIIAPQPNPVANIQPSKAEALAILQHQLRYGYAPTTVKGGTNASPPSFSKCSNITNDTERSACIEEWTSLVRPFIWNYRNNLDVLLKAHSIAPDRMYHSGPTIGFNATLLFAGLFGCMASLAGILSRGLVWGTATVMFFLGVGRIDLADDMLRRAGVPTTFGAGYHVFPWVLLGVILPIVGVTIALRRARSTLLDFGVLLVHGAPLYLVASTNRPFSFLSVPSDSPLGTPTFKFTVLGWTLLTGFLLSWYRKLPKAI
ncbi:hypothetical protein [Polyangium sorediatum]|uniref:Uncharacterized protein n=1 Tax=Polyangium sorediatum TaxID=889274 RepID=A0ABT6NWN7_9BACT|nr:hypothetical protein [Polyangium sorediatum]MDI1432757.1 hypothetical protein [Polyangium sorediatum]